MELFDLVDEHDEVIGETDKATAHREGQIHRVAAVYVFAPDGRLWVQLHKNSGLWDHTVGGHVSQGESYYQAATRESEEEIGLQEPIQRLAVYLADERMWRDRHSTQVHYYGLYECTPSPVWKFVPNEEVEQLELMALDQIVDRMNHEPKIFTPGFILSMNEYIQLKDLPLELNVPALYSI